MRLPSLLTTTMILYRLARGLGFAPVVRFGEGFDFFLYHRGLSVSTTTAHQSQPSPTSWHRAASSHIAREDARSMVLRPDWEREGRVFGLRMPPKKEGERAFEYLVKYPCEFEIKVIGLNEGTFADDIAATVSAACQVNASDVRFTVRVTSSGKYQSITVHAPVQNAKMLYRCYEMIDEDPRVKFKF